MSVTKTHQTPDLELGDLGYNGYPKLVDSLVLDNDDESLVCRKFRYLGTQNLLFLQGELYELEHTFRELDKEMYKNGKMEDTESLCAWEAFVKSAKTTGSTACQRMELVREVRAKLKEYYKAMLLQRQISRIERPDTRVVELLRKFVKNPGEESGRIWGRAAAFLDDADDLAALRGATDRDRLSQFLRNHWPVTTQRSYPQDVANPLGTYDESQITRTVIIIDIIVAALLLIGPIVALHFVTNPGALLGMVAGFTVFFVVSMSLITNARRAETFVATAAYAAVLVVFVSGNAGGTATVSNSGMP